MGTVTGTKWVYAFEEGGREMRDLLGGKGANVAEMTRILGPERVPAGFTITTEACVAYMNADRQEPEGLVDQVGEALARLEEHVGKRLGDSDDPLLVSVRSGARESMPGMMDTVLNLGLNDESVLGLTEATGNEWFAWDSYRRFVQMFGNVCRGVPGEKIEDAIKEQKRGAGVKLDTELTVDDLKALVDAFKSLYREQTDEEFPQQPRDQLEQAIRAVFDSWMGERAVSYRRINHLPDEWGTAVNVQQMVFGNKGEDCCTGVVFSRDERTGEPKLSGDFLVNSQGEDVVSGVRTPRDIDELEEVMPESYATLKEILRELEAHYKDMQDCEFTVEQGKLYMLQTRNAKRPAQAAVRFATDAVDEGLLTKEEALRTINAASIDTLLHKVLASDAEYEVLARGVNASPGAARGFIVFDATDAVEREEARQAELRKVSEHDDDAKKAFVAENPGFILVRPFTEADDVAGFHAAQGILTSEGGKASHAALVARGMGKPCVSGAAKLDIDLTARELRVGRRVLHEGDLLVIDGSQGIVTADDVPLVDPADDPEFEPVLDRLWTVLEWADGVRRLVIRTNADTPADAKRAREFGAEGIGLCRTEHMFMAADRQPKMRAMIMADSVEEREQALAELLPLQQADFEGLFEEMAGCPVTIRLLDPPLHEFLPHAEDVAQEVERARIEVSDDLDELETILDRVHQLSEVNPMLGTRGVRLGIIHPEIFKMQVRAIMRAAGAVRDRTGKDPQVEIMIPLVAYETELRYVRTMIEDVVAEEDVGVKTLIGTMIELPRACFVADKIAQHAEFFSFGTNDLTQSALGFSRDDVESRILSTYLDQKIIDRSPFETIDKPGVGWLVRLAAWVGREGNPDLHLGICGEHGGDPDSIAFFDMAGLDYVSCSPYRVPIARLAAAQSALDPHPIVDKAPAPS